MLQNIARPRVAIAALVAGMLVLAGCSTTPQKKLSEQERASVEQSLRDDIAVLASEDFGGRRPGSQGEAKTLNFMETSLKRSGFVSGTNDPANSWRAPVLLVNTVAKESRVSIKSGKRTVVLPDADAIAYTSASLGLIEQGAMVYVGRLGQSVPDEAVLGKIAIILGEPGKSPPRREALFEKGASAVVTVIEDQASVAEIRDFRSRESFVLASEITDSLNIFATHDVMAKALGDDQWTELVAAADGEEFAPIDLDATASVEARSKRREVTSYNLIGRMIGAKPGSGAVLLMAHWDHFGECGEEGDEDRLCNGAVDNASGVAVMLELAERLAASGPHDRDIYVMGTTAEEWGLFGAKAFVKNPPVPLETIVAALNYDTVAVAPRGSDVAFVGEGETPLDGIVLDTIGDMRSKLGNQIMAEQFMRRQDSWALLEAGVPAVVVSTNLGSQSALESFLANRYHKASDDIDGMELGGAVDDVVLNQLLLERLASTVEYPARAQ
ncbi:MAG: M20/M25/M40 family metallo-hydrolase [Erythrobacter sp.]